MKTPARKPVKRKKVIPQKGRLRSGLTTAAVMMVLVLGSPLYYRYVAAGFTSAWHWINGIGEDRRHRHYQRFNIQVSEQYSIHGIDVSYAQGRIDWPQVKAMEENGLRIRFVFVKATEGEQFTDPYYSRNWREAAKNGFTCGAYHYFRPGKSGRLQALHFLNTVRPESSDLPPVVDIETLDHVSPEQLRTELDAFLTVIRGATRARPILYSGLSFYQDYLKGHYDDYPLWIAHYDQPEARVSAAGHWQFWQHSRQATINGIRHAVDFDTFQGDSTAFRKLLLP
jgi:lysozyme